MLRLILSNLWIKKLRTLLTLAGLAIATGTLVSLLAFQSGYRRGLERELNQLGAHILVVPKGCPYDSASLALHGANWPCYLKEAYLTQVTQTHGVAVAAPVFMAADYAKTRQVIVGITDAYLQLRPHWHIHGSFPSTSEGVLLGAEAARRLKVVIGSEVQLPLVKHPMRVVGVLNQLSAPEDDFIFMRLDQAQAALNQREHLTHVLVKLRSPDLLDTTVQALRGCDAGMQMNIVPLAHLFVTIRNISSSAAYLLTALAAIAFVVAGTALANTMLMAVFERTREIGVLRAIGASTSQIFSLFFGETLLLGALGASIGIIGAFGLSRFLESWVRQKIAYAPETTLIGIDGSAISIAVSFAMILSIIVALLPALRAARLNPVQAFRTQAAY